MKILGIETSCDETAAAIVRDGTKILSNIVSSSQEIHIKTGGIIPEVAAREQVKCIIPVIEEALEPITHNPQLIPNIDALAVTVGPGLIGSLLVGVETAKTLAYLWNKPIVPVNHLLAHLYANWLDLQKIDLPKFPALALIVSGGHTELLLMKAHGKYICLGGTRDDAAGEAFDKIARLLDLGYPGGPTIAAEATKFKIQKSKFKIKLPRPMIETDNLDFSFSGLKTAVIRELHKLKDLHYNNIYYHSEPHRFRLPTELKSLFAYEVQEAITDVLVEKTIRIAKRCQVKSILLAGGVAANQRLREKMKLQIENFKLKIDLFVPPPQFCTDNAAGVASCAFFNFSPISWQKIKVSPSLEIVQ